MKKLIFAFIFTMTSQFVFSQSMVIKFFSMGFNTKELIITIPDRESFSTTYYYFYGYKDYSEAFITERLITLSTEVPGRFYPNSLIRHKFDPLEYRYYNGKNNSDGYEHLVVTSGWSGEEHKEENGKLVYWALTDERRPVIISDRIEQKKNSITIYAKNEDGYSYWYKYFNITQNELLDIFLTRYVDLICDVNETINKYIDIDELEDVLRPLLQGRTARELAIFRNCLFAIKGYRFSNKTWTNFFNNYLKEYNGKFSNNEVMTMFSDNEKKLLDLIVKYESSR